MTTTDTSSRRTARAAEPLDAEVGSRIAARRAALGLTQTGLAELVGVSCQQVQKYESGQNRISASRLHHMAVALGLPIGALFPDRSGGEDDRELSFMRSLGTTSEGRAMAEGFSRIDDRAVRQALTRLVEVLARAA
jgi:transcriptional regulator with XRE-family HTH domain